MPGEIVVERGGDAAWLTISSPPRNLLAPDIMRELVARLRDADDQHDVRAIVIAGAGDVFCGGLDVDALNRGGDPVEFATALVELLSLVPTLGKPVLGAINGNAIASGFSLAVLTDWAVASEGASLGTFEASIGIWPMVAQVPPLQRLLPRHALSNIITGEPFTAQRALEYGVVNSVVPRERMREEIETLIPRVTRAAAPALAAGRRAFYRFLGMPYHEALDASLAEFTAMFSGAGE
jgi:methylglutaconyl-CoA hydratase